MGNTTLPPVAREIVRDHHPGGTTAKILREINARGLKRKDGTDITRDHVRRYQARLTRMAYGGSTTAPAQSPDEPAQDSPTPDDSGEGGDAGAGENLDLEVVEEELLVYEPLPGLDQTPQEVRAEFLLMIRTLAKSEYEAIVKRIKDGEPILEICAMCKQNDTRRLDRLSRVAVRGNTLIRDAEKGQHAGTKFHLHRHQILTPGAPPPSDSGGEPKEDSVKLLNPEIVRGIRSYLESEKLTWDGMMRWIADQRRKP